MTNETKTLKQDLREYIEQKLKIENRLKRDYTAEYWDAVESGDETTARVRDDLRHMTTGAIAVLEDLRNWLTVNGGLYEDGAERPLTLEGVKHER